MRIQMIRFIRVVVTFDGGFQTKRPCKHRHGTLRPVNDTTGNGTCNELLALLADEAIHSLHTAQVAGDVLAGDEIILIGVDTGSSVTALPQLSGEHF
jgi:hypothetical protein